MSVVPPVGPLTGIPSQRVSRTVNVPVAQLATFAVKPAVLHADPGALIWFTIALHLFGMKFVFAGTVAESMHERAGTMCVVLPQALESMRNQIGPATGLSGAMVVVQVAVHGSQVPASCAFADLAARSNMAMDPTTTSNEGRIMIERMNGASGWSPPERAPPPCATSVPRSVASCTTRDELRYLGVQPF
jgi:hypothetical protein